MWFSTRAWSSARSYLLRSIEEVTSCATSTPSESTVLACRSRIRRELFTVRGTLAFCGLALCIVLFAHSPVRELHLRKHRRRATAVPAVFRLGESTEACPELAALVDSYLEPYRGAFNHTLQLQADDVLRRKKSCVLYHTSGLQIIRSADYSYEQRERFVDFEQNVELAMRMFGPVEARIWFCLEDRPSMPKSLFPGPSLPLPPFSYSMHDDYHDVSVPYGRVQPLRETEDMRKLEALGEEHPWSERLTRAVWRGSTTGYHDGQQCSLENWRMLPRSNLVRLSRSNPDILDALYAFNSQCPEETVPEMQAEGYGFSPMLKVDDYFKYKMLVDIDGNSWSSRFLDLVSSGCAVFKQESEFRDWWSALAIPFVHYVPVKEDLSDLITLMRGLSTAELSPMLEKIGREAQMLFVSSLVPTKQLCYLHVLLAKSAALTGG